MGSTSDGEKLKNQIRKKERKKKGKSEMRKRW